MAEQKAKKESVFKRIKSLRLTRGKMDFSILLVVSALCAFGLVMIFSASYYYAQHYSGAGNDSFYYLKRQLLYLMIARTPAIATLRFCPPDSSNGDRSLISS